MPFDADRHCRFEASCSLAAKENILEIPIVDLWLKDLREKIIEWFPGQHINKTKFEFIPTTDVDLPFEARGRVPTAQWKADFNKNSPEYAEWLPGDTVNLSIGQGDLLVSPLQLVTAYAAIANGGTLYRPHAVEEVLGADGRVIRRIEPRVIRQIDEVEKYSMVKRGLERVVTSGTGEGAFKGFDGDVAGKTGTAQVPPKDDFAWFASYGPVKDPRYAVVVVIEQGGGGGSIAAPAARKIWGALYGTESIEQNLVSASDTSR